MWNSSALVLSWLEVNLRAANFSLLQNKKKSTITLELELNSILSCNSSQLSTWASNCHIRLCWNTMHIHLYTYIKSPISNLLASVTSFMLHMCLMRLVFISDIRVISRFEFQFRHPNWITILNTDFLQKLSTDSPKIAKF